jgi:lysophospholipase L1-like esterase
MRRFLYWIFPTLFALTGIAIFGTGFTWFVTGNRGEPVDYAPRAETRAAVAPRVIAPVLLGDSLARGAGDERGLGIGGRLDQELATRKLGAQRTINLAVNGARTPDLLRQLESQNVRRILAESNVIIISIGGNDLWGGNDWQSAPPDPEAVMGGVLDRVKSIVETVRKQNATARIFIVGLYNPFTGSQMGNMLSPLVARWNSRLIEAFASDRNLTVVQTADLFSHRDRLSLDRFHPGGEGYGLIARRIADAL